MATTTTESIGVPEANRIGGVQTKRPARLLSVPIFGTAGFGEGVVVRGARPAETTNPEAA